MRVIAAVKTDFYSVKKETKVITVMARKHEKKKDTLEATDFDFAAVTGLRMKSTTMFPFHPFPG